MERQIGIEKRSFNQEEKKFYKGEIYRQTKSRSLLIINLL